METSVPQSVAELNVLLRGLDRLLMEKAIEWARKAYKAAVEQLDEALAAHRDKHLEIEHKRAVWYRTCLGTVKVERRQYRDKNGKRRCLLDEAMGMQKHRHVSQSVQELALEMASSMPFRRSAEVLKKASGIDLPHQTIWRMMGRSADPWLEEAKRELEWFRKTGELPSSEGRQVGRLMMEADGVMVSLQREREKKVEIKLGIAYEGWCRVGQDRYRTLNKTIFATVGGQQAFWDALTLKLERKYDLASVKQTIVGGDGAKWVKEGADYFGGYFQLDRYHLQRELTFAFGHDSETKARVWRECTQGDVKAGLRLVAEACSKAKGAKAERLAHAYQYLAQNISGLADYRRSLGEAEAAGLRRTGAIEGNVDKLVARRMKNQGMAWSVKGIQHLLCVRFLLLEGNLTKRLQAAPKPNLALPVRKIHRIVCRAASPDPSKWLQTTIPALYGPHPSRPWVRTLRQISEASPL